MDERWRRVSLPPDSSCGAVPGLAMTASMRTSCVWGRLASRNCHVRAAAGPAGGQRMCCDACLGGSKARCIPRGTIWRAHLGASALATKGRTDVHAIEAARTGQLHFRHEAACLQPHTGNPLQTCGTLADCTGVPHSLKWPGSKLGWLGSERLELNDSCKLTPLPPPRRAPTWHAAV